MSPRGVRTAWMIIGLILLVGGGLSAALGAGAFGNKRSDSDVFSPAVVRWWNEGHWMSFAVVGLIGFVALLIGLALALRQLKRHGGRSRTKDFPLERSEGGGATVVHAPSLSHALEADLVRHGPIRSARVGLYGQPPSMSFETSLEVPDSVSIMDLPPEVGDAVERFAATVGMAPRDGRVTVHYADGSDAARVD